jgi:hypothetical protein
MSPIGTTRTFRNVRYSVAVGYKADLLMTVPVGGGSVSTKKQNPSDGKRHVSMMETGTETPSLPVTETITTSPVTETITTIYISSGSG